MAHIYWTGDKVSEEEVKKAQSQLIASMKFSQDGSYAIASGLNEAIASGDWTLYTTYGEKISAVTKEDIKNYEEYLYGEETSIDDISESLIISDKEIEEGFKRFEKAVRALK